MDNPASRREPRRRGPDLDAAFVSSPFRGGEWIGASLEPRSWRAWGLSGALCPRSGVIEDNQGVQNPAELVPRSGGLYLPWELLKPLSAGLKGHGGAM